MSPIMKLYAILGIKTDEFDDGLEGAEKKQSDFAKKAKKAFSIVSKASLAATAAAVAGVYKLTKAAVSGYAEYEQLVGGVETLFGTGGMSLEEYAASVGKTVDEVADKYDELTLAQNTVLENADKAYKTAGLSANDYIETVTSFSASLISSLEGDTVKAAQYADMAIVDMSDNANKMGTDMESLQNAYAGFAKGNYTMLDNLKLGYGGTKEEMERLLETASEISGIDYDIDSYADVVSAIHTLQESMGISGTTAKEAETTITGSLNSMKAAWANMIDGLGKDGSKIGPLVDQFSQTLTTFLGNLIPRISIVLTNISGMIQEIAPVIIALLPQLVRDVLPPLIASTKSILLAIGEVLPEIIDTIIELLPDILDAGIEITFALIDGIIDALPELMDSITDLILKIADKLTEPDTLSKMIICSIDLIVALAEGLVRNVPKIIEKIPEIITNIVTAFKDNKDKIKDGALALVNALKDGFIWYVKSNIAIYKTIYNDVIKPIVDKIKELATNMATAAKEMITKLWDSMKTNVTNKLTSLYTYIVKPIIDKLKNLFDDTKNGILSVGGNLVEGMWNGINNKVEWIKEKVAGFGTTILNGIKSVFGIHSPSREFAKVGMYMAQGLGIGFDNEMSDVARDIQSTLGSSLSNATVNGYVSATNTMDVRNTIVLEGDMAKLFKAIVKQNNTNTAVTGRNALAW